VAVARHKVSGGRGPGESSYADLRLRPMGETVTRYHVSLDVAEGSTLGTGGFVDTPNQRLNVEHVPPIVTAQDLADVPIEGTEANPVKLGDVADMVRDHQPLAGDAVIGDQPGLLLVVEKFPWGNTLDVTRGVEQALDQMRPGLTDIDFDTNIFRPATFIQTAIDKFASEEHWQERTGGIGFPTIEDIPQDHRLEFMAAIAALAPPHRGDRHIPGQRSISVADIWPSRVA